jgi:23S rRNA pseudouridine955/2504/2580 synthase/23S rRNA pseudouridine1911/1915/1917 synthase
MAIASSDTPAVIALDEKWLVLYKPAGWLTIPAIQDKEIGRGSGAVNSGVLSRWANQRYEKVWTVHRIDQETSGVVLFARTANDHRTANIWFEKREIKKTYHCIASNSASAPVMKIATAIAGQKALTQVEVLEAYQEGFLAKVQPLTGRRHQIRIHLAGKGNPIWGDRHYKGPVKIDLHNKNSFLVKRVALHASKLELPTGEAFECPWPEDFNSWIETLRKEGKKI